VSQVVTAAEHNCRVAEQINVEARRDPGCPYTGKYVGIVNGQIVSVDADEEIVLRRLEQIEPDPENRLCFEAGLDYESVEEIWSAH
jgi:hypothetical protein